MPLTTCHECNAKVSTSAKACPSCGAPPKPRTSAFTWLVAVIIGVVVYSNLGSDPSPSRQSVSTTSATAPLSSPSRAAIVENNLQELARREVLSVLKDPSSAEFRNQKGGCGEVNSKNSFGAFVGYQRFIAGADIVILEVDTGLPMPEFEQAWIAACN